MTIPKRPCDKRSIARAPLIRVSAAQPIYASAGLLSLSGTDAHVFLQAPRAWLAAVDVAVAIDDGKLGAVTGPDSGVAPRIEDEFVHGARRGVADANAHVPTGILDVVRFGVCDDDAVRVIEEDSARPTKLRPAREMRAFLIEELHAIVRAVADEQSAACVHRDRVQRAKLAVLGSHAAPRFDERAVAPELDDAIVGCGVVAVGDEDV